MARSPPAALAEPSLSCFSVITHPKADPRDPTLEVLLELDGEVLVVDPE